MFSTHKSFYFTVMLCVFLFATVSQATAQQYNKDTVTKLIDNPCKMSYKTVQENNSLLLIKIPVIMQLNIDTHYNVHFNGIEGSIIVSEDFEADFPTGLWETVDGDGPTNGEYYWGKDDYKSYNGSYSMWCARAGEDGLDPEYNDYPDDAISWAVYGPFSLVDIQYSGLSFYFWLDTEYEKDGFSWAVSIDGSYFYGWRISGSSDDVWLLGTLDFKDVYILGDITGEEQVWIALIFESDEEVTAKGVFCDDVVVPAEKGHPWEEPVTNYQSIVVGARSTPTFIDIDDDNDYDLFIGESDGNINFYRNDGDPQNPSWNLITENYESIDVGSRSSPVFVDIDDDDDYDLFIGENDGNIHYYRNDGAPQSASWTFVTSNYNSIDVGSCSVPYFVDIDSDDDYDMFIGEKDGGIIFYRNDGTSQSPNWILVSEYYGAISASAYSRPVFVDFDDDGHYDLFICDSAGNLHYYRNDGTSQSPRWDFLTENYNWIDVGIRSAPSFIDIDKDQDYDLFLGDEQGSITYYKNELIITGIEEETERPEDIVPINCILVQNYPNPFTTHTVLSYQLPETVNGSVASLKIYNSLGQKEAVLFEENNNNNKQRYYNINWMGTCSNGNRLPANIYFCQLQIGDKKYIKRIVMVR